MLHGIDLKGEDGKIQSHISCIEKALNSIDNEDLFDDDNFKI